MEISSRLLKISSLVDCCDCLADIGTDHAYIPIFLISNCICKRAIASDIGRGPLDKALKNVTQEGFNDKIECRLGGGFSTISPFEAQAAIIAGMGGNLIRDIIDSGMDVFKSLDYCIIQPVQNPEVVRGYIYEKGFKIIDEELVLEDNKFYEIIKIAYDTNVKQVDEIYLEVGKKLVEKKHILLNQFLMYKLDKYNSIKNRLIDNTINTLSRKEEVIQKIQAIEELLNQWS